MLKILKDISAFIFVTACGAFMTWAFGGGLELWMSVGGFY